MQKTYLVTGGAGFIGSAVAEALLKQGHKVIVIDNLSTGYREKVPADCQFIEGNCEDETLLKPLQGVQFEAIYHIAGQSSGEVSYDNPVLDMQANLQSTLVLLKFAVDNNCRKFIYASSMSVYGDPEVLPAKENAVVLPKSFYAVGKLASEHYLRIYREFGIKTVALRLFNVYGVGQNLENMRQGMASIFLSQALKYGEITVKGSADRFRDFVYIDEVVEAFLKSEEDAIPSGIYNVCRGEKVTVAKILESIQQNLGREIPVNFIGGTPGDQHGIFGDPGLFEQTFKLKNNIAFEEGMSQMINWAKKHKL